MGREEAGGTRVHGGGVQGIQKSSTSNRRTSCCEQESRSERSSMIDRSSEVLFSHTTLLMHAEGREEGSLSGMYVLFSKSGCWHSSPAQLAKHTHAPFMQAPCPLQRTSSSELPLLQENDGGQLFISRSINDISCRPSSSACGAVSTSNPTSW